MHPLLVSGLVESDWCPVLDRELVPVWAPELELGPGSLLVPEVLVGVLVEVLVEAQELSWSGTCRGLLT